MDIISPVQCPYRVGDILQSFSSENPSLTWPNTVWEPITGKFLFGADATHANKDTGGEEEITLTTAQLPAHSHGRGTQEITGMLRCFSEFNKGNASFDTSCVSGAFYFTTGTHTEWGSSTNLSSGSSDACRNVPFAASRSWSGTSEVIGQGAAINNMPPYITCYMWTRIA